MFPRDDRRTPTFPFASSPGVAGKRMTPCTSLSGQRSARERLSIGVVLASSFAAIIRDPGRAHREVDAFRAASRRYTQLSNMQHRV
jgi:hypothetical protein